MKHRKGYLGHYSPLFGRCERVPLFYGKRWIYNMEFQSTIMEMLIPTHKYQAKKRLLSRPYHSYNKTPKKCALYFLLALPPPPPPHTHTHPTDTPPPTGCRRQLVLNERSDFSLTLLGNIQIVILSHINVIFALITCRNSVAQTSSEACSTSLAMDPAVCCMTSRCSAVCGSALWWWYGSGDKVFKVNFKN